MFESNDIQRRQLLRDGIRHDVQGNGRPVIKNGPGPDDFELIRGLPVTVDDDTARQHYQAKFEAGTSKYDGNEMMGRYRFSVAITKIIEALYRRGYDMEVGFAFRVKAVNKTGDEEENDVAATSAAAYMIANGAVEAAMKEAIRIAETYSFISLNRSRDQYAFNMEDFQSYVVSKSKRGEIRGELIHLLHYYDLITVPAFKDLVDIQIEKSENKPLRLKYLAGTPLLERRGINALMPFESTPQETGVDVIMEHEPENTGTSTDW